MYRAASTRFRGVSRATGLLLGTYGVCYFVSGKSIHLDAALPDSRSSSFRKALGRDGLVIKSILGKHKLVETNRQQNVDAESRLRDYEQSIQPPKGSGIDRVDVVQTVSNHPTEDDYATAILPVPSGYWSFFSVLDGHSGWQTSAWLRDNLILAAVGSLADLYSSLKPHQPLAPSPSPSPSDIGRNIKDTFLRLDDDIVNEALKKAFSTPSKEHATKVLGPAEAGSCALLSFFDSDTRLLHMAITGDSRAILGRRVQDADGNVTYEVHKLTEEQDGYSPTEQARLAAAHPGEEVVKNGRVMGMGPSRAFGDARYKWMPESQWRLKKEYAGRTPSSAIKTPPYLTAEPEVTSIHIQPGDFLVMATDGLWECLTSEEAVGLVGWWCEHRAPSPGSSTSNDRRILPFAELPIRTAEQYKDTTVRHRQWGIQKEFVGIDKNAATHLVRNALGGANSDMTASLLRLRLPLSRRKMDDITALVVFFDDQ